MAETYCFPVRDLQILAQQRFPSLSPDDTYLTLHHEMLIKYPTEIAKIISLDSIELLSIALTKRNILGLIRITRLSTKVVYRFKEVLKPSPADA